MALEIERKFLVDPAEFFKEYANKLPPMTRIEQGYICKSKGKVVRVRIDHGVYGNTTAILCVKLKVSDTVREEYEYDIPLEDGHAILEHFPTLLKDRFHLPGRWVVDQFRSHLCGLYLAEVEVDTEEQLSELVLPKWVIEDVTTQKQYSNSNLIGKKYNNGLIEDI